MQWQLRILGSFLIAFTIFSSASHSFASGDVAKTSKGSKASRVIKGAACILALGAIVKSYTLPHYVPNPEDITPYLDEYSHPPYFLTPWDYESAKHLKLVKSPGREVFGYVFGPMSSMMRLLSRRMMLHRSPLGALRETAHDDFRFLVGYFLIYAGLRRINKTFFHIDIDQYDASSRSKMKPNPKKVLYLSSIPEGDSLAGFPEFHFQAHYGEHPDAKFMQFSNLDDLVAKLVALPQDSSIDRIEIFIHGNPNTLQAADGSKIKPKDLERLLNAKLNIAAAGADVRFVSCSLAGGRPFDPKSSEEFIRDFGNAFLPLGGQVIAASRTIVVADGFFPPRDWSQRHKAPETPMNRSMEVMMHTMGLGNFKYLWLEMLFNLYRNFPASLQDAIAVEIPPRR